MENSKSNTQRDTQSSAGIKRIITIVLIPFTILTVVALVQFGPLGVFAEAFKNFATIQVFCDLLISCIIILVWMYRDAKQNNRKFWPWCIVTLAIGSFGPLIYLLLKKEKI